jgi:hypothetical protein
MQIFKEYYYFPNLQVAVKLILGLGWYYRDRMIVSCFPYFSGYLAGFSGSLAGKKLQDSLGFDGRTISFAIK